jgi:hypothetical protein
VQAVDKPPKRDQAVAALFERALEVIDSTLTSLYGVPNADASQLEQELFEWFSRLARRPSSPDSVRALRPHLISMACKVGHVYWMGKPVAEQPKNETVRRSLALGPEIIAVELEARLTSGRLADKGCEP